MNISNEHLILLSCCKAVFNNENVDEIYKLSNKNINWEFFLQLSLENRVSPIMYSVFKADENHYNMPDKYFEILCERNRITSVENSLKQNALLTILKEAKNRKMNPVCLKGAALIYSTYSEFDFLRESRDLDILINENEIEPFCTMLKEMGFEQGSYCKKCNKIKPMTELQLLSYNKQKPNHVWPFYKLTDLQGYTIAVEPHISITSKDYRYQIPTVEIINTAVGYNVEGIKLFIPDLIYELLILCMIAFVDYSSFENMKIKSDIRLRTYCDILNLAHRVSKENKWNEFCLLVNRTNNQLPVFQTINFCEELFDVKLVPEEYLFELKHLKKWKYAIHNFANFNTELPIGYWEHDCKHIFADTNRYYNALDKMYCNSINNHYSCVRELKQKGTFIKLEETHD